jgi:hypothetical protein
VLVAERTVDFLCRDSRCAPEVLVRIATATNRLRLLADRCRAVCRTMPSVAKATSSARTTADDGAVLTVLCSLGLGVASVVGASRYRPETVVEEGAAVERRRVGEAAEAPVSRRPARLLRIRFLACPIYLGLRHVTRRIRRPKKGLRRPRKARWTA